MKINKLQINDFGKFSNKEIIFKDGLNVVRGNNESGKSTIQKFIVSMFYGISSDKRKSNFTDYDKYFPWNKESFTGKINYTLDDGQTFEIYRDFTKRNPIVYNEYAEDITNRFSSNKSKDSKFFEEQTGIDEQTMISSMVSEQMGVVVGQSNENYMIQKIANLTETGDEKISYDSAKKILIKKRNDNIGTNKTRNKPINILQSRKRKLEEEKALLEEDNVKQYEIEKNIAELKKNYEKIQIKLDFANRVKRIVHNQKGLEDKAEFYFENEKNNKAKLIELKEQKTKKEEEIRRVSDDKQIAIEHLKKTEENTQNEIDKLSKTRKKAVIVGSAISLLIAIFAILSYTIAKSTFASIGLTIIMLISIVTMIVINLKNKKNIDEKIMHLKDITPEFDEEKIKILENDLKEIDFKISLINSDIENTRNKIDDIEKEINYNKTKQFEDLKIEFDDLSNDFTDSIINSNSISMKVEEIQRDLNNTNLKIKQLEYEKKAVVSQLEKFTIIEEEISDIEKKEEELLKEAEAIELASQVLDEAYDEMKKNVVPKFTEKLSSAISYISKGKYSKVLTNDVDGLMIERENGEYIPAKALSAGTIDQLYLALRITIAKQLTNQSMPLIMDETFAYFDKQRLKNALEFLNENFHSNQIILFTCTSRETDILEEIDANYNLIEL